MYYELFRQYVLVLYEHKEIESEINGGYEVIKFLAHLFRDEIKCFVERTEKALLMAKTKKFNLVGTLRNVLHLQHLPTDYFLNHHNVSNLLPLSSPYTLAHIDKSLQK